MGKCAIIFVSALALETGNYLKNNTWHEEQGWFDGGLGRKKGISTHVCQDYTHDAGILLKIKKATSCSFSEEMQRNVIKLFIAS